MQEAATIIEIVEISDGYFQIAMIIAGIKTMPLKRSLPLLIVFLSPLSTYHTIYDMSTETSSTDCITTKDNTVHAEEQLFLNQSGNVSYVSLTLYNKFPYSIPFFYVVLSLTV